jgi:hypothetical protein
MQNGVALPSVFVANLPNLFAADSSRIADPLQGPRMRYS